MLPESSMRTQIDHTKINPYIKPMYKLSSLIFYIAAFTAAYKDRTPMGAMLAVVIAIQAFLSYQGDINCYLLKKVGYNWEIADRLFCLVTLVTTLVYFVVKKKRVTVQLVIPLVTAVIFWVRGMAEIRNNENVNENWWALCHIIWHVGLTVFLTLMIIQKN